MKKILAVLLICAVLLGCNTASDISYATVEKSGFFIAGYDPENYHTSGGYGLAVDIIKTAAKRMGVNAPIYPVTNYDWQTQLENNNIDVMLCAKSNEDFETAELFYDEIILVTRKDVEINKIGVIDSASCIAQKDILSYSSEYEYTYYSNSNLLLGDIELGIVDGGILSEYDALSYNNISNHNVQTLDQKSITFVVSKNSATFYEKLNASLLQMVNDGTINRLKQEYINSLD